MTLAKGEGAVVVVNVTHVKYPPEICDFEGWQESKRILVILAHPDDPEFFCGATLYRWAKAGHAIKYCLFTTGQKGSQDPNQSTGELTKIRTREQKAAGKFIGVKEIEFLDYVDGELVPDLEVREKTVRVIRNFGPQIVVTSDPQNYFTLENRLNHPDHRAAGQIVLDAIFPAAGNPQFFKNQISKDFLKPVNLEEVWISATNQPDLLLDMTAYFHYKVEACMFHASQISKTRNEFDAYLRGRFTPDPETGTPFFPERFRRLILQR
jgi:LmbE family N-acetylglucosaminyl deacetylase